VRVGCDEQAGEQVEGNEAPSMDGQAVAAERLLQLVSLGAGGVQPEAHGAGALAMVTAVALEKRRVVVCDAEVA
jgi:hypothetical protein